MAHFDLICRDCGHRFQLVTGGALRNKQKRCRVCASTNIRQTLASYLQNGPLSSPTCGEARPTSGFG